MRCLDIQVVEPADTLPITIEEFIDHGRLNAITIDVQPDLLMRELTAATNRAELYCRRALITQTLKALFVPDGRSCGCGTLLVLPRPPVQTVESVTSSGTTVDASVYTVEWGVIMLTATLAQPASVLYKAGYGDGAADVPALIREGILRYATALYENRTGQGDARYQADAGRTLPAGVIDCWRPYQVEVGG